MPATAPPMLRALNAASYLTFSAAAIVLRSVGARRLPRLE